MDSELNLNHNLNLVDIQNMIKIIDVVSRRGAIMASEMKGVGELYDKLVAMAVNASETSNESQSNLKTNMT